ncbi:MAG: 50S ribosomal protein L23 [Candidatus ainarchaeum sp.]|nr:50S ribosomal protein L23 [Candidatus ainarchaeum sp.]
MIIIKPLETEKWIGKIEFENTIAFQVDTRATKKEISDEINRKFSAKAKSIRTHIKGNKKIAIVSFGKEVKAEDIATKMKMI